MHSARSRSHCLLSSEPSPIAWERRPARVTLHADRVVGPSARSGERQRDMPPSLHSPDVEAARCRSPPSPARDMPTDDSRTSAAAPRTAGRRWTIRLLERIVENMPAGAPPAERRLLRSVYTVHRSYERIYPYDMPGGPTSLIDDEVWMFAEEIFVLSATAADAVAAGVGERYVGHLLAMTWASVMPILEPYMRSHRESPEA